MTELKNNTFGNYQFEDWIPAHVQESIIVFWGQMGRTHKDWLIASKNQNESPFCHHGPNLNGFQIPPYGATCEFFIKDWELSKDAGQDVYKIIKGRYIHRWNNMGSLIIAEGVSHCVSSCDRWVRIFTSEEEKLTTNKHQSYVPKTKTNPSPQR